MTLRVTVPLVLAAGEVVANIDMDSGLKLGDIPCGAPAHASLFQATKHTRHSAPSDPPVSYSSHTVLIFPTGSITDGRPSVGLLERLTFDGISYPTH